MAGSMRQNRHATSGDCGGDTTMTKIFVGGLAWETRRDSMRRYFEQFGEIIEAVVITDKHTGRSKGYGFVTFKEPESASRACLDPAPIIDGRRANCNLASEGHHRPPPPPPLPPSANPPPFQVCRTVRPIIQVAPPGYQRPSTYLNQSTTNYTFPYWYPNVYSQENVYPYGYYNLNGGGLQQYQFYTGPGTSNTPSVIPGYYNLYSYSPYAQPNQGGGGVGVGYGLHYGQVVPYQYLTQQYTPGLVPLPPPGLSTTTAASPTGGPGGSIQPPSGPDQMNSA